MKKFIMMVILLLLTSCSAISVKPTLTPTFLPTLTPTLIPTVTVNPCSDEGWVDISIYLGQYDQVLEDMKVGDSIAAFLEQLTNYKEKISGVEVAACTEYAKQKILKGINTKTLAFYSLFVEKDNEKFIDLLLQGELSIGEAYEELKSLGIDFSIK